MDNFNLSHNQNHSIAKQDLNAPSIKIIDQANHAVDNAMTQPSPNLWQKLFLDETDRAMMEGNTAIVKSQMKFVKRALDKTREAQLQASTEVLNQYLVRLKGDARANTTEFLMAKLMELQEAMDQIYDRFIAHMSQQLAKIEQIDHPKLRQMQEARLDQSMADFMEQQQLLMAKFQRIVSEEV